MALDRQTIEKRDFPIGRRGYEPEAVDAHLALLADQLEDLKRSGGQGKRSSLAATASAQVQAIVEAAEQSAASIEREAEDDASRIRKEAAADADRTRGEAVDKSQDHVSKVRDATSHMLQRVDTMEGELGALVESLRTGANRLSADLALLEGNMGELYTAAGESTRVPQSGRAAAAAESVAPPEEAVAVAEELDDEVAEPEAEPEPEAEAEAPAAVPVEPEPELEPEHVPEPEPAATDSGDVEGARLVALNMALNGQTREETDRYLAENFELTDRTALLDEVYATVE